MRFHSTNGNRGEISKSPCYGTRANESGNEDKHLHENYTDRNIPLENGENDKEHNYRESSTFIPSERDQIN
ncbi:hypothetical protein C2G38_2176746 [Gigaspora rosea]|uniref:Uncharacterized protein n=1 Tax=Gigaspora rosea TaxID=44941 RepID=A0A397VG11_9GLOM|nr:hypothetical protein C2G38_2176746 [Gigaspora rosea]